MVGCFVFSHSLSSNGQLNIVTPSGDTHPMTKSACFRMVLWLCIYNEFFAKKVSEVWCM